MATLELPSSQHPPSACPSTWVSRADANGHLYYTDPASNEWYRETDSGFKRMDTMEKIFIASLQEQEDKFKNLTVIKAESLNPEHQSAMIKFMDLMEESDPNIAYKALVSAQWDQSKAVTQYIQFKDIKSADFSTNPMSMSLDAHCLQRMSTSEQILFAEQASKREYFMSSTNCSDSKVATECLVAAQWNTDNAVREYFKSYFGAKDDEKEDKYPINKSISMNLKEWNVDHIMEWINSLDHGRYQKYGNTLKSEMTKQGICGMDLVEIRERDLMDLGVDQFRDRRAIYKQIRKLIATKSSVTEHWINRMSSINNSDDEPDEFCCPISYEIFVDPVIVTVSGQTYERKAIEQYIRREHQDPITLQKAEIKHIVPNRILKIIVEKWRKNKRRNVDSSNIIEDAFD